jgi:protein-tyrosine-phosphatase
MIDKPDFNPNVSLELGYMLGLKRHCLLLKEKRLPMLMTDLAGFLYKQFDADNISNSILGQVANWLQEVGVRKAKDERLIVFVSGGGTCRCAMAKAITRHFFHTQRRADKHGKFRVESRAAYSPSRSAATDAAINVAKKTLGEDLLSEHRPRRAGVGFLYEADLILATDQGVLGNIRNLHTLYPGSGSEKSQVEREILRKSHLLTEFFGATGDVPDPWPDNGDACSEMKYRKCMTTLYDLIAPNVDKLIAARAKAPPLAFGTAILSE